MPRSGYELLVLGAPIVISAARATRSACARARARHPCAPTPATGRPADIPVIPEWSPARVHVARRCAASDPVRGNGAAVLVQPVGDERPDLARRLAERGWNSLPEGRVIRSVGRPQRFDRSVSRTICATKR
jgi:hypothetical protein